MSSVKKEKHINKVYNKDARAILDNIPSDIKITATITSPPYFDMKDYNSDNQIGFGQTYQEYLDDLKLIFSGVFKVTDEDGSLWIIIDTFKRDNQVVTLPFDLSTKLKEVGWLLQDVIIWKKDKTVPWSSKGFMQRKFEYILYFTKTNTFKSNKDKVRIYDTDHLKKWWVKYPERYNPKGKALDEVWEFPIPVQGSWGDKYISHFCPLPKDMVATMIQISTDENDLVLDPFAGSGTVLSQSAYMKRRYIGFELNNEYIKMFKAYLNRTFELSKREYEMFNHSTQDGFQDRIIKLRLLKFARVLVAKVQNDTKLKGFKIFVGTYTESQLKNKIVKVKYQIITKQDQKMIESSIFRAIAKPPLSKFGIEPEFEFRQNFEMDISNCYGYTITNSYSYNKELNFNDDRIKVISAICVDLNENDYL